MRQGLRLVPTGAARAALGRWGSNEVRPAFPYDLVVGAEQWEDGAELLHLAWELARCAPEASAEEARALVLLAFAALLSVREGSTRMPARGAAARSFLGAVLERLRAREGELDRVLALVESPPSSVRGVLGGPGCPLVLDGDWLALQRLRHAEEQLVGALRARLALGEVVPEAEARAKLAAVLALPPLAKGKPLQLSDEQQQAVLTAVRRPMTVITGGPGTGKTSIVVSILRTLVRLGVAPEAIALAAPTGKAAMRMDESVRAALGSVATPDAVDTRLLEARPPARTLHRLLGYSPSADRFLHHAGNPLPERVVIVDESSMVDLFLMDRLVRSLTPDTRLVLLGDADQLPSVDAGAVFRDLVEASASVRLTQSYRLDPADPAGRNILTVARGVKAGELVKLATAGEADEVALVRSRADALAFKRLELLECAPGDDAFEALLVRWDEEVLRAGGELGRLARREYRFTTEGCVPEDREDLERLFRRFESARLLCLTRSATSAAGTGSLNAWFHARAVREQRQGLGAGQAPELLPGEPVLVEENDYERKLFNGDQGVVVRGVEGAGRQHFMVAFRSGDGFVAFHLEGLRSRLRHAYAMTVHKSQGSEFDRVALVLPEQDLPLLTRELLYTGMTRARSSVVVVGARELFRTGVARGLGRWSGVAERLGTGG